MLNKFVQRTLERALAEQDQLAYTLVLHRLHPTFRKRIQIWTLRRQFQRLNAGCRQCLPERVSELRVSVVNHVMTLLQKPGARIGRIATVLHHPLVRWVFVMPAKNRM